MKMLCARIGPISGIGPLLMDASKQGSVMRWPLGSSKTRFGGLPGNPQLFPEQSQTRWRKSRRSPDLRSYRLLLPRSRLPRSRPHGWYGPWGYRARDGWREWRSTVVGDVQDKAILVIAGFEGNRI